MKLGIVLAGAFSAVLCGVPVWAQTAPAGTSPAAVAPAPRVQQLKDELDRLKVEFDAIRRAYDERLLALEDRIRQIGTGPLTVASVSPPETSVSELPVAVPPVAAPQQAPDPATPAQAAASSKIFNPDMSVNGNFVGFAGKNPFATPPALQLSEAEVAFQAIVDPYARADFYLAASSEGLEIEEGYITFTALPAGLLLKAGKMRAQFGRVNTLHTHRLPTVDRPLVIGNLVGGDEGLSDGGLSLSKLMATQALFLEATGEVYGGSSDVFQATETSDLTYVGRVRAFRDLTEGSNIDLGTSFAFGRTDLTPLAAEVNCGIDPGDCRLDKTLTGIDATFRYRPLRRAIYTRFNLSTELIWSRQNLPLGEQTTAFGYYGLGEYQFARRWYVGGRFDRSGRDLDGSLIDKGGSVFVTFWPTEFSQVRGQYRRTNFADGQNANEFLFQFNFSIGAHGAHVF